MPDKGLFDIHCHIVPSVDERRRSTQNASDGIQTGCTQYYCNSPLQASDV